VDEALEHPYFVAFHDPANEVSKTYTPTYIWSLFVLVQVNHNHPMDFSFESLVTSEDMKGKCSQTEQQAGDVDS
jgi:hypothetical protein